MNTPDILIYVEDPGAANMVLGLPAALAVLGIRVRLFAGGSAENYLRDRDEVLEPMAAALTGETAACVIGTSENPDTPGFALAADARAKAIPTVCLVDGPANADRRLQGRGNKALTHLTDWLVVADESTHSAFAALGVPTDRIRVVGNPALDRVCDAGETLAKRGRAALRRELFPSIPAETPLILFLTELSDGLDPQQFRRTPDYTLHGRGGADGRTEIVLEEVLHAAAKVAPDAALALRLHPKTPAALYADYERDVAAINVGGNAHPALYAADLVIGLSTALLSEAAVLGRPALSVLPRESEVAWLAGGDSGLVPHVSTRDALCGAVAHALSDPKGFMASRSDGAVRPHAAPRIARALAAIASGASPAPDGTLPYAPPVLETERLILEPFSDTMLTERYVGWLNDPDVVRYSEQRHLCHSLDSCHEFIQSFTGTRNGLWAIREKAHGRRHIGNISTEIDRAKGCGDIRILIGERAAWGTGLGAEAWQRVMAHLFDDLGLGRVTAGTLAGNLGMRRIMEKAGMRETHRRPGPTPVDGRVMDMIYAERWARNGRQTQ